MPRSASGALSFSLVLSLSIVALVAAVYSLVQVSGSADHTSRFEVLEEAMRTASGENETAAAVVDQLRADVAALVSRVQALEENLGAARVERDREPSELDAAAGEGVPERIEELVAVIEELAGRLAAIETTPIVVAGLARPAQPESEEARQQARETHQPIAVDPARPPAERLAALKQLRFLDGGRTLEVTQAMIDLIRDPNVPPPMRADIIRNLHGVDFPELKQPLLEVLATSPDAETRSETIETLDVFYDDPIVYDAVRNVRDHDEDPRVRLEALNRMLRFEVEKKQREALGGR